LNSQKNGTISNGQNKLRTEDRAVHDWYRFVLSFPPHLVEAYLERLCVRPSDTVLDPFCGTGTTLVQCKKLGIASLGIESNPMAYFASSVKVDWSVNPTELLHYADEVAASARSALDDVGDWNGLPLLQSKGTIQTRLRGLTPERSSLLLKDSISPLPLHRSLVLLEAIDRHRDERLRRYGRLALANALVNRISNLKFGPEVGLGRIKDDAPVLEAWLDCVRKISHDITLFGERSNVPVRVVNADSRGANRVLPTASVDAVITSPPYPNEKDYTRTTRLESVILGLIRDRHELRALKRSLIRSNTRGVYKSDTDDREIAQHAGIRHIADEIERRRIELGKTSGFERLYSRVTLLYFGGMAKHLSSLRPVLRPGAKLAYVVGDQASYLRVMIRTGQLLADLARSLGYRVMDIDLFRTRTSTVTGDRLREEVVLLEWPGT
jgi:DNA modification methylase